MLRNKLITKFRISNLGTPRAIIMIRVRVLIKIIVIVIVMTSRSTNTYNSSTSGNNNSNNIIVILIIGPSTRTGGRGIVSGDSSPQHFT